MNHTEPYNANNRGLILHSGQGHRINSKACFRIESKDCNGRLTLLESEICGPGEGVPLHTHTHFSETLYIIQGLFEVLLDNESHQVADGAVIHIPDGVVHSIKNTGEKDGHYIAIFAPGGMEGMSRELAALKSSGSLNLDEFKKIEEKYHTFYIDEESYLQKLLK